MANREVSVAICGAVVGVILGAGSLSFSQDASLHGSAVDVIQNRRATDEDTAITRQRNVNRRIEEGELGVSPRDINSYPTVKDDAADEKETKTMEKKLTVCSAVREVLDAMILAHDTIIPKTLTNTGMRASLAAKIAAIDADTRYCNGSDDAGAEESSTSTVKTTKTSTTKDPCSGLTPYSTRYTLCKLQHGSLNQ